MAQPGPRQSLSSHTSEDDENEERFSAVLSVLDREQLPLLADSVLRRTNPKSPTTTQQTTPSVGEPMYGSYHVLFPLTFATGLRWVVKIPINGTAGKWNDSSASALASEASTMRMLKRETTIPLPEVLGFSSTTQNILHCPYILMTFISGVPLYDVWFGHRLGEVGSELTQTRRIRALEDIAAAMIQLGRFAFSTGGSPVFGKDEKVSTTGPIRRIDHKAMMDRWFVHEDPDDDTIYVECAAHADPRTHYTHMLEIHPAPDNEFTRGGEMLLRLLISWIPEPDGAASFVFTHPDFDIQNFIVSENGELQAIIDWDGIAAMPRSLGNERYPGWLTRDWDPVMYGYKESMDQGVEPEGVWEDSPTCLAYYRGVYDKMMARCRAEKGVSSSINLCRMSLVTDNIAIAAEVPGCRADILKKLTEEIWAVAGKGAEMDFYDLLVMFAENNVDDALVQTLREGFDILLSKEGL